MFLIFTTILVVEILREDRRIYKFHKPNPVKVFHSKFFFFLGGREIEYFEQCSHVFSHVCE